MTVHKAQNRVLDLRDALRLSLIEREPEIDAMLLGLVAQEHVLLVGAPGTGKSMLSTNLTHGIDGAQSFTRLLTKFTTPEEVFGPVMLSALRKDEYRRAYDGYAPTAHVLFLDEIWKASSAILNTLLTLLQERQFDNGGQRIDCPLRIAIAASNEWPSAEEGQELGAVFDRFLIRRTVHQVSPQGRDALLYNILPTVSKVVSLDRIDRAHLAAMALPVPDETKETYSAILDMLGAEGVRVGDRRARKGVGIAKAHAWVRGADHVEKIDLECLGDVLWGTPEHADKTVEIVSRLSNPVGAALNALLREVEEIGSKASSDDPAHEMAAIKQLEECAARAEQIAAAGGNGRATQIVRHIRSESVRLRAKALGMDPEKARKFMEAQGAEA